MNNITEKKIKKYLYITEKAMKGIKIAKEKNISWNTAANDFLDMAQRYFKDAVYYHKRGDAVTAFAAVNYAHGWLDAGARIGFFKVKHKELFVID